MKEWKLTSEKGGEKGEATVPLFGKGGVRGDFITVH